VPMIILVSMECSASSPVMVAGASILPCDMLGVSDEVTGAGVYRAASNALI
jgi:hypothetical protein